jgi:uncharacterized membrane protein YoaK (UPF0700 family)
VFVAQAHSFTQQARLAVTLAWVAGYTNVLTILSCGTVTSHASGSASQWGRDLVEGAWAPLALTSFLLGTFIVGAMLSALCTETGRRRGWESIYVLPITIEALLLTAFALGLEWHDHELIKSGAALYAMTGLASMAMGLQNATITRISNGVVRTTHMTGVVTDLGLESVQFLFWLRDRNRNSPPMPFQTLAHSLRAHPTAKRLGMLGTVLGSFAIGAGLGAAAYERLPQWATFPPVLFLLWVIVQDIRRPICEIEASTLTGKGGSLDLPIAIAVYHLRKDKSRTGGAHRLPNLLAWSERLPQESRVVILELDPATQFDDNTALELRSVMQRFESTGRRLVIAGVDAAKFQAMLHAGTGDVLDPTNVCTDLELAIAKGLTMLDGALPAT